MKVRDITECIEAFAPLSLQESYDNAGLIVGRYDNELTGGVLLAVDVTDEVIESPQSIVIPEAMNREISAQVVLKRILENLK